MGIGIGLLQSLRPPALAVPVVVDRTTGQAIVVPQLTADTVPQIAAIDQHHAAVYVRARESYAFNFLKRDFEQVARMSTPETFAAYGARFAGETAMQTKIGATQEHRISIVSARPSTSFGATESTTAQTDGARLSLRATLHYLWEEAGLHRWMPGMSGKRNWSVVRKYLLEAASDKTARGAPLASMLYIPETFSVEHKEELLARRIATLGPLATGTRSGRKLLLLIGEVKQFGPARYGHKMIVKHVPDTPFVLSEDAYRRLMRRCGIDLELWNADPSTHLLVVGTFGQEPSGVLAMEELSLQVTTAQWLPFEHRYEAELLEVLVRSGRRFTKGLRYNLGPGRPIASLVLADTADSVVMYLVPPGATESYRTELDDLIAGSEFAHWVWHTSDEPMPAIPPPRSHDMRDFNPRGRDTSARSPLDAQHHAA